MAGAQFEYDKSGGTSYYFITTFFALALIPTTYYFWPRKKKYNGEIIKKCHCDGCHAKFNLINALKPKNEIKNILIKIFLVSAWLIFFYLAYYAAKVEKDFNEYDPYAILEIDRGVTVSEIKKKYRQLSAMYHPDVKDTGDSNKFMKIAKAYAALTDEDSRKNWEEFGNPDGPGATTFGIALPAWIVEKGNSIWVLTAYIIVFMIVLPVLVGTWWYKSIKYSGDKVLIDTTQMYMYFFHKTPNMMLKRVIMILAASFEFCKFYNTEIHERPSDNFELPQLLKRMTNLNEKNKERPLSAPYSIKARILFHAHLTRLDLPANTLDLDKKYILKKCPALLNEMVNCVAQLMAFANSGRIQHSPRLETMENIMKTSQMIIQALWEFKSPLLQLPHIGEDLLKHCINKKYSIRTIKDLATMKDNDRRSLFSKLTDREYGDVIFILSKMPHVELEIVTKVMDDEDPTTITANSIVTVTVTLVRKDMSYMVDNQHALSQFNTEINSSLPNGNCLMQIEDDKKLEDVEELENMNSNTRNATKVAPKQPTYKPKKKAFNKGGKHKTNAHQNVKKNKNNVTASQKSSVANQSIGEGANNIKPEQTEKEDIKDMVHKTDGDKEETKSNTIQGNKTKKRDKKVPISPSHDSSSYSDGSSGSSSSSEDSSDYSSQDGDGSSHRRKRELKDAILLAGQEAAAEDYDDDIIDYRPYQSKRKTENDKKINDKTKDLDGKAGKNDKTAKVTQNERGNNEDMDNNNENEEGGDELWDEEFQQTIRRRERVMLEGGKPKDTFEVHCPYFPEKKFERWWLYMADRKHSTLITAPLYITSLNNSEEFQLKFPAPPKPGIYAFTVVLRSDSYLDCDFTKNVKLDVKEEKKMEENHPQWDISDSEPNDEDDNVRGKHEDDELSHTDNNSPSGEKVNSTNKSKGKSNKANKQNLSDLEYTTEEESDEEDHSSVDKEK
ncbi:unnamed protein product [Gordionus sp. m RMFG-2023]|uniref:translocation protein SEC63 homolog n=1 Tax=Gordionus sp. m RMFG-2023 TaxID=3053472 RepID=UPI0030DF25CA